MEVLGKSIEVIAIILLIAIILRFVLSWTGFDPRNPVHAAIFQVTEPILAPIRQLLPRMSIDLSPMIATFILFFLINLGQKLAAG